jgi:hypothetical protein
VDGSAVERVLGFQYSNPVVTDDLILSSIRCAVETKIFPNLIIRGRLLFPAEVIEAESSH